MPESMSQTDLEQLLGAVNEVTSRLTRTHEQLTGEVARLKGELSEANRQVQRSKHLAMLGEMAAGIAHEVRNPLGSIGLYARMLVEDLGAMPAQQTTAKKIAEAVRRLDAVVTDVLAFSREVSVRPMMIDAGEALRSAIEASRSEDAMWVGVQVEVDVPDSLEVLADPGLLQQALVNVIRNAVQAMQEAGSPVRVLRLGGAKRRVVGADGRSLEAVVLSVRDTGPGVPADVLPRLFNPFFTTRETGTGLGLAIVHRIIDAHGGTVFLGNAKDLGEAGGRSGGAVAGRRGKAAADEAGAVVEFRMPMEPRGA
ncbi:MAG: two-component system sensor histidine kinase NtrB [Phycisphaerales bacterium]